MGWSKKMKTTKQICPEPSKTCSEPSKTCSLGSPHHNPSVTNVPNHHRFTITKTQFLPHFESSARGTRSMVALGRRRGWIPSDLPPCCEASPPRVSSLKCIFHWLKLPKMLGVLGGFIPDNLLGPFAQKNVTKNVKENPMKYWPHFSWVKLYFFPHFPKSSWVNPTIFMGVTTHPHLLRKASASRRAMEGTEDASNGMASGGLPPAELNSSPAFAARSALPSFSFAVSTLSIPATCTCLFLGCYPDQTEWLVVADDFFRTKPSHQRDVARSHWVILVY